MDPPTLSLLRDAEALEDTFSEGLFVFASHAGDDAPDVALCPVCDLPLTAHSAAQYVACKDDYSEAFGAPSYRLAA